MSSVELMFAVMPIDRGAEHVGRRAHLDGERWVTCPI
jgi:hypothetical protein